MWSNDRPGLGVDLDEALAAKYPFPDDPYNGGWPEVRRADGTAHIYDFGLTLPAGEWDVTAMRSNVENAFSAAWHGESEVDHFNELVLRAGLTWRQEYGV